MFISWPTKDIVGTKVGSRSYPTNIILYPCANDTFVRTGDKLSGHVSNPHYSCTIHVMSQTSCIRTGQTTESRCLSQHPPAELLAGQSVREPGATPRALPSLSGVEGTGDGELLSVWLSRLLFHLDLQPTSDLSDPRTLSVSVFLFLFRLQGSLECGHVPFHPLPSPEPSLPLRHRIS